MNQFEPKHSNESGSVEKAQVPTNNGQEGDLPSNIVTQKNLIPVDLTHSMEMIPKSPIIQDTYKMQSRGDERNRSRRNKGNDLIINIESVERLIVAMESLRTAIQHSENEGRGGSVGKHKRPRAEVTVANVNSILGKQVGSHNEMIQMVEKLQHKNEKVMVEMRLVFLKIGEIDTLKEQYQADLFIQAKWRESYLDGKDPAEIKSIELEKLWNPQIYIENIIQEQKESTWYTAQPGPTGEMYVYERRRVKGVLFENLELNDFPLDCQDLSVTLTSERPCDEVNLIADDEEISGINVQTFADMQEWQLHEHVEITRKTITQDYSATSRAYSALSITCRAARRPGYFYYNVFLIMFFITGLSFATFSVSPDLPQNRLQLSFTLLLTSIAFKFVINQMLPKISYLTYMDKYVLMSLIILCVICIWHAVVTVFVKLGPTMLNTIEAYVFIAFGVLYVISHLVFFFWLYVDACKRRRIMSQKDREYKVQKQFYRQPTLPANGNKTNRVRHTLNHISSTVDVAAAIANVSTTNNSPV